MTIVEQVQAELRQAMKSGRRGRLNALRLMFSALQRAEKDRPAGEFADADAQAVLRRERKQRIEAAEAYRAAGQRRPGRGRGGRRAGDRRVPAPADVRGGAATLVDQAIAETGATSMRDMGKVMGLVTQRSQGRADGRAASDLVKARLSG